MRMRTMLLFDTSREMEEIQTMLAVIAFLLLIWLNLFGYVRWVRARGGRVFRQL